MYITKLPRIQYRERIEEFFRVISAKKFNSHPDISKIPVQSNYLIKGSKFRHYPSGTEIKNPDEIIAIIVDLVKNYIQSLKDNGLLLMRKRITFYNYSDSYKDIFTQIGNFRKRKPRRNFKTLHQIRFPGDPEPINEDIFDPETVDIYDPENIDIYDPENIDIYDPENIDIYDPENIDIYDPENIDIYDPENIDIYDPENIDIYDPENVDIFDPVAPVIYDPKLGTSSRKSYYRVAANIKFPNEPPGDPAPENEDIYDPLQGDIKDDLILFIENGKFLAYPNGNEIQDFHSVRDILVHLIGTYKD